MTLQAKGSLVFQDGQSEPQTEAAPPGFKQLSQKSHEESSRNPPELGREMPSQGPGNSGHRCRGSGERRPGWGGWTGPAGPHSKTWLSQATGASCPLARTQLQEQTVQRSP